MSDEPLSMRLFRTNPETTDSTLDFHLRTSDDRVKPHILTIGRVLAGDDITNATSVVLTVTPFVTPDHWRKKGDLVMAINDLTIPGDVLPRGRICVVAEDQEMDHEIFVSDPSHWLGDCWFFPPEQFLTIQEGDR